MQHDVAEIFRKHIGNYKKTHRLSYEQAKAVSAIINDTVGEIVKPASQREPEMDREPDRRRMRCGLELEARR